MEELLNELGPMGFFLLLAIPGMFLLAGGTIFRGWARRRTDRLERALRARRPMRDIAAGSVTLSGKWRNLPDGRGTVEEDGTASLHQRDLGLVVCERPLGSDSISDGAPVLVLGIATRQCEDPRPSDAYRSTGRVWVVDTRVDGSVAVAAKSLEDQGLWARRFAQVGASAMALGVLMLVSGSVIGYRASKQSMYAEPFESAE